MLVLKITIGNEEIIKKVKDFPFTIGRSIKNNLILNHDSISGEHAVIKFSEDGLRIKDLNSTNGIIADGEKIDEYRINENVELKLGEVVINFILDEEHLDKTRVIELPPELLKPKRLKDWQINSFAILVIILSAILEEYITAPLRKDMFAKIIKMIFGTFFVLISWSGVAGLISKVQSKKYRFIKFFSITARFLAILIIGEVVYVLMDFYFNNRTFSSFLRILIFTPILFGFIYLTLIEYFEKRHRKMILMSLAGFFFLFAGTMMLGKALDEDATNFNYNAAFMYSIKGYSRENYSFKNIEEKIKDSMEEIEDFRKEDLKKINKLVKEYDEAIK